jgi:hypothetical protein
VAIQLCDSELGPAQHAHDALGERGAVRPVGLVARREPQLEARERHGDRVREHQGVRELVVVPRVQQLAERPVSRALVPSDVPGLVEVCQRLDQRVTCASSVRGLSGFKKAASIAASSVGRAEVCAQSALRTETTGRGARVCLDVACGISVLGQALLA